MEALDRNVQPKVIGEMNVTTRPGFVVCVGKWMSAADNSKRVYGFVASRREFWKEIAALGLLL